MSQKFIDLMTNVQKQYDIVIIDTPPILAVTDAAIIGMQAGTSMVVAGFEQSTVKEVEVSVRRFEQNGIEIKGAILNTVVKKPPATTATVITTTATNPLSHKTTAPAVRGWLLRF